MRLRFILSMLAIILLVVSCFLPWISFESRGITFRGVDEFKLPVKGAEVNWGRPGYFHLVWGGIFLVFLFVKKGWATWVLFIAAAFNLAWAFRNFLMLPACGGGQCPERNEGLYLLLAASVVMVIGPLLSTKNSS